MLLVVSIIGRLDNNLSTDRQVVFYLVSVYLIYLSDSVSNLESLKIFATRDFRELEGEKYSYA